MKGFVILFKKHNVRVRPLGRYSKPYTAASGAEVEHHRISCIAELLKRQLDNQFRLGSRHKHTLADLKRPAEKIPFAEDILERLAGYSAQNSALNKLGLPVGNIVIAEHYLRARKPRYAFDKT